MGVPAVTGSSWVDSIRQAGDHHVGETSPRSKPEAPGSEIGSEAPESSRKLPQKQKPRILAVKQNPTDF